MKLKQKYVFTGFLAFTVTVIVGFALVGGYIFQEPPAEAPTETPAGVQPTASPSKEAPLQVQPQQTEPSIEEQPEDGKPSEQEVSAEQAEQLQDVAVQEYRRQNVTFLKMVSSENGLYVLNDEEIEELRTLRINTLRICPLYSIDSNGDIRQDVPNFLIIDLIRRAHSAGFAVFLEPNLASRGGFPHLTDPQYVEAVMEISSKWAEIAEEENVEFYSPLNEPNLVFSEEHLVEEWMVESQNLRSMFSGGLVLKLAGMGPEEIESLGGYDYLAFDIMWGDSNYDELRNYLNAAVAKGNSLKQKYGLKGFFFGELGAEKARVDEDTQAEIFRTILDETWEEVDGYCFLGWSELEFSFKDNEKAKDVIREWFSR